jgi:hypothetical protein
MQIMASVSELPLGLATVKNETKFVKIIEIDHEFAKNLPPWLR